MFNERLEAAKSAALKAGEYLLSKPDLNVTLKAAHDYVTEADKNSEKLIRNTLLEKFPEDGFFGEEFGGVKTDSCWIVDPIDGTTNFIQNIPYYTVSIAYRRDGEVKLGVVYCPPTGEMFYAVKGEGAYLNGAKINAAEKTELSDCIVGMSFAHRDEDAAARMQRILPGLTKACSDMRRMGSAALDLCYTACGRYDAFIELTLNIYDFAAGMLIAEEAGAVVTKWPGDLMDIEYSGNVFAAAKSIYDKLFACVKEADADENGYSAVLVLGHRLKPDNTPTDDLIRRINKTVAYWKQTSIPYIMPCGGITKDRDRSEAEVMREMLIARGVPDAVIRLEDKSRTTGENIVNAKKLLGENAKVVLISSDYHMEHALMLCEDNGLKADGIGAYTPEGEYKDRQIAISKMIIDAIKEARVNGEDEAAALHKLFTSMMEEARKKGISPDKMF